MVPDGIWIVHSWQKKKVKCDSVSASLAASNILNHIVKNQPTFFKRKKDMNTMIDSGKLHGKKKVRDGTK